MTVRILLVCTGNVCRSPLAAQLLSSRLEPGRFTMHSAGTSALIGQQMTDQARMIATRLGAHRAEDHRAVALDEASVAGADLVLGMEREHRRTAAQKHPNAVRRAFTLLEFAHLVSQTPNERLCALIDHTQPVEIAVLKALTRIRGTVPRLTPERFYDVEDPYRRSKQVYERSSKSVDTAVHQIVDFFDRTRNIAATGI